MTDYTQYLSAVSILAPYVLGIITKWGHGKITQWVHAFRTKTDQAVQVAEDARDAIDSIDNALQGNALTVDQATAIINKAKAAVATAQQI